MNKKLLLIAACALSLFVGCGAMQEGDGRCADSSANNRFEQSDRQCAVCLQEITGVMTTLSCGHRFCEGCINGWRTKQAAAKCPICRCEIPALAGGVNDLVLAGPMPVAANHVQHVQNDVFPAGQVFLVELFFHNFDRAQALINVGVDIHFDADRPMRQAFALNDWLVVRWLIDHGVSVHFDNDRPMREALGWRDLAMVYWLIEHGVDVHFNNEAPMRMALEAGDHGEEMRYYLCERGGWRTRMVWFLHGIRHDRETQTTLAMSIGVCTTASLALGLLYERLRHR